MATLELKLPENFVFDEQDALMTLAAKFYQSGKFTLGQAAELAGLSKIAFMELLSFYGVNLIDYPVEELKSDVINAKNYSF
jgi:predicted HTH domain antitoxin